MKKNVSLSFVLLLTMIWAATALAQTAPAAAGKAPAAKVVQMLEGSGQTYAKAGDGIWVVKFKGNQLPDIAVLAIYSEGMLIFASTVAEKPEYKATPEMMQKLLNLNDSLDRVKIGLNEKDGGVFVRIDLTLRVVDQQEFNANLEQISAAADETYAALKPFLLAPKKAAK